MKQYNKTVSEIFGLRSPKGEVGIEVEVEGNNLFLGRIPPYWAYHLDHSLRGAENAEYVLEVPISRDAVKESLSCLFRFLKENGAVLRKDSPNTSVHVHLNVSDWSLKKVYNLITVWYILEQTLTGWCGEDRVGNVFCLRGSDAEHLLQRLASAIRYTRFADIADQEGLRYSALNYTAMSKFGSLEFRSLAGVYEQSVIYDWVSILLALKDFSEKFDNPTDIVSEFSQQGSSGFLESVLGRRLAGLVYTKDTDKELHSGMRLVQGVAYCVNWEKDTGVKDKPKKKSQKELDDLDDFGDIDREILRPDLEANPFIVPDQDVLQPRPMPGQINLQPGEIIDGLNWNQINQMLGERQHQARVDQNQLLQRWAEQRQRLLDN